MLRLFHHSDDSLSMTDLLLKTTIPGVPMVQGKVRDVFDFGDRLLFVASDRISAFDYILPSGIPRKGEVLNRISRFWFDRLDVPNHFLSDDASVLGVDAAIAESLRGRSMVVTKTEVIPFECVVRGYLSGSGWNEYQNNGQVCGISLPSGLEQSSKLAKPIFTPATKAATGHDENISFETMKQMMSKQYPDGLADRLKELSLHIYEQGVSYAAERGIIIADTKFEFGIKDDEIILIDEVLTPDSSRFWPRDDYRVGISPPSFDKQFVRNWLLASEWDRNSEPPALPDDIIEQTAARYREAFEILTGQDF